ncbi:MAG: orotate phosphoribosyltransferase, partial [Verrucomicrobiota bacterium]|nr:orotate phosphoribosyltransferase [Verrucomicrobiota bacterium]
MPGFADLRSELLALLAGKSVKRGNFTLASGARSDFYIDAKLTTLDPRGAILAGQVGWEVVKRTAAERKLRINAIGGLTMGADPLALSIGIAAQRDEPQNTLQTFSVRKEAKKHGRHKLIEGNFSPGDLVVVVDDVCTTGGSTVQAIEAIEAARGAIAFALVLVDREEGGRANIEQRGYPVVPIFTRSEVLAADAWKQPPLEAARVA